MTSWNALVKAWLLPIALAFLALGALDAFVAFILMIAWGHTFISWWMTSLIVSVVIDLITTKNGPGK